MKQWRLWTILACVVLAAAIIIVRLFYIQVVNGKFYQSQALGQQMGFAKVQGARGEIFFENGKAVALNKNKWIVSAIPKNIKDKEFFAKQVGTTVEKLAQSDSYVILQKDATTERVDALKKLNLDGLSFEKLAGRYYPQESLASQVVGFVGGDQTGQYGLEGYNDTLLQGKQGIKEEKKGLDAIGSVEVQDLNGSDVYLTMDYNIQFAAESLLREAHKNIDIDSGQIIVVRPDSGRILAMANYPQFNPNEYGKQNGFEIFQNATMQKIFEPGSVFKPFTMAMGLEEGKITPETTFTDTGSVKIGPDTLYNFDRKSYGLQDMSHILEKSINTGAVFVEQKVSHATFFEYLNRFGFNDKTGIALQGEVSSSNARLKSGSEFDYATSAFGQGVEMTPLQLVKAFTIFPNGGKISSPYVVEKIVQGADESITKPKISDRVISEKTAKQVTKMMINVVDRGFGDAAKIPGYYLAGKTGTAEIAFENKAGYYTDRTIQSFIGFGPALKPQFLILVKLDNPKVPKSSLSAAPIFKKLAQYIINYWQIPPDYPVGEKK